MSNRRGALRQLVVDSQPSHPPLESRMDVLPVKRGSKRKQPPAESGADGKSAAFGITHKDSLYVGKMECGEWGPRYRSMPPSPNNWEVSFQWHKVEPGRQGKYTRSISDVVSDMASQFCSANESDTHDVSGLYSSEVRLVSETPPPQFGATTFHWQEPCHVSQLGNEIVENLDESIRRQCLCLMGGAPAKDESQS